MSFYDPLETRDPDEREDGLMDKLARQVAHAKETTSHYFHTLAGINPFEVVTREALARSEALVRDHPNFQLAQLAHGDEPRLRQLLRGARTPRLLLSRLLTRSAAIRSSWTRSPPTARSSPTRA